MAHTQEFLWQRLGAAADCGRHDSLASAAKALLEVAPALRVSDISFCETSRFVGYVAQGAFEGENGVSFFWGDAGANLLRPLDAVERNAFRAALLAQSCYAQNVPSQAQTCTLHFWEDENFYVGVTTGALLLFCAALGFYAHMESRWRREEPRVIQVLESEATPDDLPGIEYALPMGGDAFARMFFSIDSASGAIQLALDAPGASKWLSATGMNVRTETDFVTFTPLSALRPDYDAAVFNRRQ